MMSAHIHTDSAFSACRSWVERLPEIFSTDEGKVIRKARNELREMSVGGQTVIVKSFAIPNLLNRLIYGTLRKSKAERSFCYAQLLRAHGIGSPQPVAWMAQREGGLLSRSYYVSLKSACPYTFADVMAGKVEREADVLTAIACTTARLHGAGMIHKDYSRGNILIGFASDGSVQIELIDLNRIRFRRNISIQQGLSNLFERLPVTPQQRQLMQQAYLDARQGKEVSR